MSRVCALNNYPLEKMWARARAGTSPRQHLWGIDGLAAAGHTVSCAPFHDPRDDRLSVRLTRASRGMLGLLDQELYALRRRRGIDVLYCADQFGLSGLALSPAPITGMPLISVVHHPAGHRIRRAALARHDVLLGLSERVCEELSELTAGARPEIRYLPWGPDLDWSRYRDTGEEHGVVSAGKSNRDVITLLEALGDCRGAGVVYDFGPRPSAQPPPGVRLVRPGQGRGVDPGTEGAFSVDRVMSDLAGAAVVAIPVARPDRLTGLTEAVDALALGKPLVATRSAYFPFDIEALGCGIWVDPGDRDGWSRALGGLLADGDRRREMGDAGRRFAQNSFNYAAFCAGLRVAVADVN